MFSSNGLKLLKDLQADAKRVWNLNSKNKIPDEATNDDLAQE
eukprot:CAMPEP_0194385422 /NCGR_PEP_ID=MMETSP0174-20130528/80316_1 /TAXON_ID=216777 /ORGANISM="Proboscia alata, Strain PI-D3" /LENGTH=41 /DNA_ID= /DNA_START= /DNA_END= /DNA_ORIENTATION=